MTETTKKKYSEKRLIQLTREQEERMAAQSVQKVQTFVSEAAQIQSRRCEFLVTIVNAQVMYGGVDSVDLAACHLLANQAVEVDARQKWADLKALFTELGIHGPQPHLEWAAKQVGVTLFEALPEAPMLITQPSTEDILKVVQ